MQIGLDNVMRPGQAGGRAGGQWALVSLVDLVDAGSA